MKKNRQREEETLAEQTSNAMFTAEEGTVDVSVLTQDKYRCGCFPNFQNVSISEGSRSPSKLANVEFFFLHSFRQNMMVRKVS